MDDRSPTTERRAVRRGYDQLSATYAHERADDTSLLSIHESFLGSLPADARLLDAGCGPGDPFLSAAASGPSVDPVGLDFSREGLSLAAETVPTAALVQGDMTCLPFGPDAFDALTALNSLIHVPYDEYESVFDGFARVLRPGGRLLCTTGTDEWAGSNPDWLDSGVEMRWHILGPDQTIERLELAGFSVVDDHLVGDSCADDGAFTVLEARLEA
jgi:ubiquinone/menaquinone biosynthesis C-methylase UbiE